MFDFSPQIWWINYKFNKLFDKNIDLEKNIEDAIDIAWESIYTPQPKGCATHELHNYLELRQRQRVVEMLKESKVSGLRIKELSNEVENISSRIEQLSRRRIQLQSILGDGQLQDWLNALKKLDEQIEELKTMNQLYRSQRLESDEEISSLFREKDKIKLDLNQSKKE